jgi:hypothetical protein
VVLPISALHSFVTSRFSLGLELLHGVASSLATHLVLAL